MSAKDFRVGFLPWWPENPYQVLLRGYLKSRGVRVIGNPPLSVLRLLVNRDGLDVVHVHWFYGLYKNGYWKLPYVVTVLLLYRLLKNNIVWTVHEIEGKETRWPWVDRFVVRLLLMISRVVVVHSRWSKKQVEEIGARGDVVVARHPSYFGVYPNEVTREEARRALGIGRGTKVVLYLGYVRPYKGVEDLIASFRAAACSEGDGAGADTVLVIAGKALDREYEAKIRELAEHDPRVRLVLGYVPDDKIQCYMNAADIVAFPFRRLHTSGSILLALGFGKPVIAPRLGSVPEYVDDTMALLFDPEDPEGLTGALAAAWDRDLEAMGRAALARAMSWGWEDFGRQHLDIYASVAGRSPGAP